MAKRGVTYTAKIDDHERVIVGSQVTSSGERCARLRRFGQDVTTFLLSVSQRRALNKGKRIHIHAASIDLAHKYGCVLADGGLGRSRRKKRR